MLNMDQKHQKVLSFCFLKFSLHKGEECCKSIQVSKNDSVYNSTIISRNCWKMKGL
jgi:hypothetical protein